MKHLPNLLSTARIVMALSLMLTNPLSTAFLVLYILCGVSDMMDGWLARRLRVTSVIGARLDSCGDFIMVIVVLWMLFPAVQLSWWMGIWLALIAGVRFLAVLVGYVRFKSIAILHTYGNKLTGLVLFATPLFMTDISINIIVTVTCFVATTTALEEMLIQMTATQLNLNQRSLF